MKSIYVIYDQSYDDPISFFHAVSEEEFDEYVEAMYQKLEKQVNEMLLGENVVSVDSPLKRLPYTIGNNVTICVVAKATLKIHNMPPRQYELAKSIQYAKINMWERGQDLPEL